MDTTASDVSTHPCKPSLSPPECGGSGRSRRHSRGRRAGRDRLQLPSPGISYPQTLLLSFPTPHGKLSAWRSFRGQVNGQERKRKSGLVLPTSPPWGPSRTRGFWAAPVIPSPCRPPPPERQPTIRELSFPSLISPHLPLRALLWEPS